MGGVINIVTQPADAAGPSKCKPQYGNRDSPKVDVFASDVWGKLGVAVDGSAFDTDGFPPVVASERGPVDNNAAVNFRNVNLEGGLQRRPSASAPSSRGGYFRENRDNGKASTIDGAEEANDTRWKSASGGVRVRLPDDSDLQARVFARLRDLPQQLPGGPGRDAAAQRRPDVAEPDRADHGVGGIVQWSRGVRPAQLRPGRHRLALGGRREPGGRARLGDRPQR